MNRRWLLVLLVVGSFSGLWSELCWGAETTHSKKKREERDERRVMYVSVGNERVIWRRNDSNPALGKAWRDSSGMTWGEVVKVAEGIPCLSQVVGEYCLMEQKKAAEYCKSIEAELPQKEDYRRIRAYMGYREGTDGGFKGYKTALGPLEMERKDEDLNWGLIFWTDSMASKENPLEVDHYFTFNGLRAIFEPVAEDSYQLVRCVVPFKVK